MLVEMVVDAGGVNGGFRMRLLDPCDTLRRRHERDNQRPLEAARVEQVKRGHRRSAGRQHGVHNNRQRVVHPLGKLLVVFARLLCRRIPVHPHKPHARSRDQAEDALQHADAGAQNRYDQDLVCHSFARRPGQGRLDLDVLEFQVLEGLVGDQHGQFARQFAKLLLARPLVAQQGHFVLYERVLDLGVHVGELISGILSFLFADR